MLSQLPAEQRAAQLLAACGEDAAMRGRLEKLLAVHDRAGGFMAEPAGPAVRRAGGFQIPVAERPGDRIGPYKLVQRIGEGGCGVVYMAEQEKPMRRLVALKVIKLGMDTRQVVARFDAERQALALMDHPHIAKVLDAGATGAGRPFFVMELVRGIKITDYCDQNQIPTQERLELFVQVCRAVQHAHQKGIIHRDLKPSNILVTVNDGVAVPKIIDFGIAKATQGRLTDKTLVTAFEQFIGTPAYMSPEQAVMTSVDVDTRSDIYSLGVLLYELLTGRPPFDTRELLAAGLDEMRRAIRERLPLRPSTRLHALTREELTTTAQRRGSEAPKLISLVRGDLDWIVMKCLEKDRSRRYETASGLAMDVRRHLNQEPVIARPPSKFYEFQRTVQRHKLGFAATGAVVLALLLGILASAWQARRAEAGERLGEQRLYAARMNLAQAAWEENHVGRVLQLLEETASYPQHGFEWYYWQRQTHLELVTLRGHLDQLCAAAFSPDGRRIVTGSKDRTAIVWDAASGKELLILKGHLSGVISVAYSPDGQRIVTGSQDSTAKVWEAATGKELLTLKGHSAGVRSVAYSRDGGRIVTGSEDRSAKVWDAATRKELLTLKGHTDLVSSAAFSPDGQRIATASKDATAKVWDAASGRELFTLKGHTAWINSVAFSPDGQRIVTGSDDKRAKVWDAASGKEQLTLEGHGDPINSVAFSPDGQRIVTGSEDHTAKVWDAASGRNLLTFKGHTSWIGSAVFSPDGRRIVTCSDDGTAKVWEVPTEAPLTFRADAAEVLAVAFSADGKRLATGGVDQTAKVWDGVTGKCLLTLEGHIRPVRGVAFSADGRLIATASGDHTARLWDATTGKLLLTLTGHTAPVAAVAFSPDGKRLVTSSADQTARIWDTASGQRIQTLRGHTAAVLAAAFWPDGRRIVTGSDDRTAKIWDAADGRLLHTLSEPHGTVLDVSVSPDNRRILAACADQTALLWDASTGTPVLTLKGHSDRVRAASFSPDGLRIITGSEDATAKVWDANTGEELLTLKVHTAFLEGAAISSDGRRVAACAGDGTATIWTAATPDEVTRWQDSEKEATERLAALRSEREAAAERDRLSRLEDPGALKVWLVLSPLGFTNQSGAAALAEEQIPKEAQLHPRVGESIAGGMKWRPVQLYDNLIDFDDLNSSHANHSVAYAVCYVRSAADQSGLSLLIGSQDGSIVYLNGREVYRGGEPRSYVRDQDVVTGLQLKAGLNVVVFKVVIEAGGGGGGDWGGSIRFTDAAGRPVKGIRATITPSNDEDPGAIHDWLVLAPIRFEGTNGVFALNQQQLPNEARLHPGAGTRHRVGKDEVVWRESHLQDYSLDFRALAGGTNSDYAVAYAVCYIQCETHHADLNMKVGSDDQAKVYLNAQEIYRYDGPGRPLLPDQDEVAAVELKAGLNTLVFKVVNQRGDWGGSVRFTDPSGQPVKGLRVTLDPGSLAQRAGP